MALLTGQEISSESISSLDEVAKVKLEDLRNWELMPEIGGKRKSVKEMIDPSGVSVGWVGGWAVFLGWVGRVVEGKEVEFGILDLGAVSIVSRPLCLGSEADVQALPAETALIDAGTAVLKLGDRANFLREASEGSLPMVQYIIGMSCPASWSGAETCRFG